MISRYGIDHKVQKAVIARVISKILSLILLTGEYVGSSLLYGFGSLCIFSIIFFDYMIDLVWMISSIISLINMFENSKPPISAKIL